MELQIGSTIGDYQILSVLGAGGMGSVYLVRNLISDRVEALKVLLADLSGQPDLAERFQREIKVQGSLEHPNIAQLRTAFRNGNQLLMVMEYVDGLTLEKILHDHGPLPVKLALDVISQVLSALEYAHGRGVVHRDIKPANMILTRAGVVKLMDFGIAKAATDHKLTMTGTTMGSIYYMSPEQIQGSADLDGRADLYSVGVTLYQLVTGKRPFDGDSQYAVMAAHLQTTPIPPVQIDPNLPQTLNDMILMSVAKDPNGRFQTAGAFRNALQGMANSLPGAAEPIQVPMPPPAPIPNPPLIHTPAPTTASPIPSMSASPLPPTSPAMSAASAIPPTMPLQTPQSQTIPPTTPLQTPQSHMMPPTTPLYAQQAPHPGGAAGGGQRKSNRGLWMALGGIAAAAVIVCAIEFIPWKGVKADNKPIASNVSPSPAPPAVPTPTPVDTAPTPMDVVASPLPSGGGSRGSSASLLPSPRPGGGSGNSAIGGAFPVPSPRPEPTPVPQQPTPIPQQPTPVGGSGMSGSGMGGGGAQPAGPSREEMLKAREHVAKLRVRAESVRNSLQGLRRSQQSQGLNLSAKFTGPEGLMTTYLRAAEDALNASDLPAFREYAEKAEHQIEILEKLLNL